MTTRLPQRPNAQRAVAGHGSGRGMAAKLAVALGSLALASGCSLLSAPGGGAPQKSRSRLEIGEWHKDSIDCRTRKSCTDWFELQVDRPGRLRIAVYAPVGKGLPELSVELSSAVGNEVLGQAPAVGRSPQRIDHIVAEGDYRVKIQGRGKKDLLSYEVVAKIEGGARPRPPANVPRRPRPEPRTQEPAVQRPRVQEPALPRPAPQEVPPTLVEVLEVERENGEPVAVLIDAGTPMGIEAGLRGSLVDNGQQIGRIEIVDVYDSGSRARLIGPLAAPITIDTEAVLRLPLPE